MKLLGVCEEIVLLPEENSEKQNIVDVTMKALMRRSFEAIFHLYCKRSQPYFFGRSAS